LRRSKNLVFKTRKRRESDKKRRIILGFGLLFLLFALASSLYFLQSIDFDFSNILDKPKEETTSSTTLPFQEDLRGRSNILVFCASDNKTESEPLRFVCLINADLDNKRIRVAALSPQTAAEVDGKSASYSSHFKNAGAKGLKAAVENSTGIKVDRYVLSNDTGFKKAMQTVGAASQFSINVDDTIDHKGEGYSLFLPPGEKSVNSDILLKFLRYNAGQGPSGLEIQAQVIRDMLFRFVNEKNVDRGEQVFEQLFNHMRETDINSLDFHSSLPALKAMASDKNLVLISVEQDFSLFSPASSD